MLLARPTAGVLARLLLMMMISGISAVYAQNSQISGRILDPSQRGIDSAVATLTREGTGDHRETVSTPEGYYSFPLLIPGTYDLTVTKQGFETYTREGITVETGQISAVDLTLSIGALTQKVDVEASAPLLQEDTSAVAHVVDNQQIAEFPLLDRRSAQLARINGFVVPNGAGTSVTFAIAGGRGNNTNYFIDGGTAQNVGMGTPTLAFDPPVEAMQEFNVDISNYAAELGRTGGGVVQMTTKSGTNQFHGSAYEFFRNDVLNANTFFATRKPTLRYNLYGVSLGGPIKKDKTYFFFNYEGRNQILATTETLVVPTQAELHGNFSADKFTVKNPLAGGTPFSGNIIPSSLFPLPSSLLDPIGVKLAAFYPVPNVAGAASGKVNFVANDPATTIVSDYVARIDHTFSDKDRIFGRFLGQPDHTTTASIFPTPGTDQFGQLVHDYFYSAGGAWTHNLSATTFNELQITITRRQALTISAGAGSGIGQQLGLSGVNQSFFPSVTLSNYAQLGAPQSATGSGQERQQTPVEAHQFADNVTKIKGTHQIKFGVEYKFNEDRDLYQPSAGGYYSFTNQVTGSSVASLLLGWVNQGSVLSTYRLHNRLDSYAGFVQDDWRITPRFTLNLGLRYDVDSPRYDVNNRQNEFNPTEINPVSGTPGVIAFSGIDGQSKYAHRWDLNNFGPRLGFAWRATDNWVVRGGGGILYLGEYDFPAPVILYNGFSTQATYQSPNNNVTPAFILSQGFPSVSSPTTADLTPGYGAVKVGQTPNTSVQYFQQNRSTGYLYQYNLDIQRQISTNLVLDIGYLGTFGHHLPAPDPLSVNQVPTNLLGPGVNLQSLRPYPQFGNVQILAADIGRSNYNGVNAGLDKRLSNGLQFKFNYTYAKFLDNVASRNELGAPTPITAAFTNYYNLQNNWGLSGNDIRHRIVGSVIYDLPVGKGKFLHPSSRILNTVAGGWTLGTIIEFHTGTPLSPFELTNNTGSFSDGVRPNVVGNPNLPGDRTRAQQLAEWFNVDDFAAPAQYTFGDAGRTFGVGPSFFNIDASLLKSFSIERVSAQFRAEALNFTNHANFANPNTLQGSSTFGEITTLLAGNQARILVLGLHLQF
jgi:outer membrane receptor protein involved in Fe transport